MKIINRSILIRGIDSIVSTVQERFYMILINLHTSVTILCEFLPRVDFVQ